MKILFLAAYSNLVAASRIKVYQFLPLLKERRIKCEVICFTPSFLYRLRLILVNKKALFIIYYLLSYIITLFKSFWAILIASKFDIIYIQEPIIPSGLEKILKLVNKNIIFQFTDAIFLSSKEGSGFIKKVKLGILSGRFKRTAKIAKCCLVENDYNKGVVLKYCPYVEKITGPVDINRYFLRKEEKENDNIIIGWIGSPFTTKYLYEVEDALKKLSKKYNIVLRLIGAKKDFKIEGINCEIKEWKLDTEVALLSTFNIGIMPLTDEKWSKGKAGYKLLQYMSMGIPSVASSVGFNKELIEDGVNGFLANTNKEWVEKLSILIKDEKLRKKISRNARITIEEHYSLKKSFVRLLKIFENTVK
jgi:glycosyltransferase involved in cell wall biosynthesis